MKAKELTFVKRKYNPAIQDFLKHLSDTPHPNFPVIAEVHDDYYVMEYIEGKTLEEELADKVFPKETAKEFLIQLIDAVELLHKFNIVHRDIKPENIIISTDGTLKLIDFDIARKIVNLKNRDTRLLGTAGYAAPEQFGFTQTDERSDIYAIGIVYNYMLTGKSPFEELAVGQTGKIIQKCIKMDKRDRYKSTSLLRKDVKSDIYTSYKLFEILPGFRTKNPYKMVFASASYILFIMCYTVLIVDQAPKSFSLEAFLFYAVVGTVILYNILFFSVLTNFLNVVDKIKFPIKKKRIKQIILLLVIYLAGVVVCFGIFGNFYESIRYNPISITFLLYGYILYSLIQGLTFGML